MPDADWPLVGVFAVWIIGGVLLAVGCFNACSWQPAIRAADGKMGWECLKHGEWRDA